MTRKRYLHQPAEYEPRETPEYIRVTSTAYKKAEQLAAMVDATTEAVITALIMRYTADLRLRSTQRGLELLRAECRGWAGRIEDESRDRRTREQQQAPAGKAAGDHKKTKRQNGEQIKMLNCNGLSKTVMSISGSIKSDRALRIQQRRGLYEAISHQRFPDEQWEAEQRRLYDMAATAAAENNLSHKMPTFEDFKVYGLSVPAELQ